MAYNNPSGIVAMTVILGLLALISVILRFVARRKKRVPPASDDWVILAGLLTGLGLFIMELYGVAATIIGYPLNYIEGNPEANMTRLVHAEKVEYAYLLVGLITMCFVKTSITLLYKRIFQKPLLANLFNAWLAVIVLSTFTFIILELSVCGSHLEALFGDLEGVELYCAAAAPATKYYVAMTLATDFLTIIIPIPLVWNLQMPTHRKVTVIGVFMVALLSLGSSIARAYIYIRTRSGDFIDQDRLKSLTALSIWNYVESTTAIIVACFPVIPAALPRLYMLENLSSMIRSLRRIPSQDGASEHAGLGPESHNQTGDNSSYGLSVLKNHEEARASIRNVRV